MDNNDRGYRGLGLWGLAALWGLITQALSWAGIIEWPLIAIWGPLAIATGFTVIMLVLVVILALIRDAL